MAGFVSRQRLRETRSRVNQLVDRVSQHVLKEYADLPPGRRNLGIQRNRGADVGGSFDTKLPLNINDEDISTNSAEPLEGRSGFTEMTFFLTRAGVDAELWHNKRDRLLVSATKVVEFGHLLKTNEKTTQWSLFIETYAQWHALVFLLSQTSVRPTCPMTDRAWRIATLVYHRWKRGIFQDSVLVWKTTSLLMKRATAFRSQKLGQDEISKQELPAPRAEHEYDEDAASTDLFNNILSETGLQTD
ncbi:hypothetical protein VE03_09202 [Pseudogymnoascus sp. 23342-1-I1]|nr:hypothetical protein VE03_09202 [Pseudogymnoascus sp. 23342-1-I1]